MVDILMTVAVGTQDACTHLKLYTSSNAMNSANTPVNILSYKNMRPQVAAPQLRLLIITPLAIKLLWLSYARALRSLPDV